MFRPRGLLPPRSLPPSCQDTRQPWRLRPSSTPVVTFRCIGYASRPNGQLTAGGLPPPAPCQSPGKSGRCVTRGVVPTALSLQLFEQGFGLLEVGRVEPLREPAVDRCQQL